MNTRHVTEATLRVRDVLYEMLLRRRGEVVTEELARERANNGATQVLEALAMLAEERKPPPVRPAKVDFSDDRISGPVYDEPPPRRG